MDGDNVICFFVWILNCADFVISDFLTGKYGYDMELNPLGVWILSSPWGQLTKILGVSCILLFLNYYSEEYKTARFGSYFLLVIFVLLFIYEIILLGISETINPF